MKRLWFALSGVALGLAIVLAAATAGRLGPLATCGADGAVVCIVWPGMASAVTWLLFIGILIALALIQARDWRGISIARRELAILSVVLLAALAERVWRPDLTDVGYDEASAARCCLRGCRDQRMPSSCTVIQPCPCRVPRRP